ncbi:MAG: hypothetical protein ACKOSS_00915 [Planctomycetia bacterium]
MPALSPRRLALAGALALLALTGACGTGGSSSTVTEFFFQAVGPQGGIARGGPVTVVFPAGALAEATAVVVQPDAVLLAITQPSATPCTYGYAGPSYCVGPIDLQLLVPGTLVLRYELADLPLGATPADLVVLLSDPGTGHTTMQPVDPSLVALDTAAQTLTYLGYGVLGHVAVGVLQCPPRDLFVEDYPGQFFTGAAQAQPAVQPLQPTLWAYDTAGLSPAWAVDTGNLYFDAWAPSPSSTRVLLRIYPSGSNSPALATVPWAAGGTPRVVLAGDLATGETLDGQDGHFGWLLGPAGDTVFGALVAAGPALGKPGEVQAQGLLVNALQPVRLVRRDAQALALPTSLVARDGTAWFLDDVRQSSDGSRLAVRWSFNSSNLGLITPGVPAGLDVLTPVPALLSQDAVPPGTGVGDPRFLQASSDLVMLDSAGATVQRWKEDGTFVATLFTPPAPGPNSTVTHVGFAVAPDNSTYALVDIVGTSLTNFSTVTAVTIGRLAGGPVTTLTFSEVGLDELAWHPSGQALFLDLKGGDVRLLQVQVPMGQGAPAVTPLVLPADDMRTVDVNRDDGRIVVTVPPGANRLAVAGGVYVLAADGSNPQQLDTSGRLGPRNARWMRTWRTTAGTEGLRVR